MRVAEEVDFLKMGIKTVFDDTFECFAKGGKKRDGTVVGGISWILTRFADHDHPGLFPGVGKVAKIKAGVKEVSKVGEKNGGCML